MRNASSSSSIGLDPLPENTPLEIELRSLLPQSTAIHVEKGATLSSAWVAVALPDRKYSVMQVLDVRKQLLIQDDNKDKNNAEIDTEAIKNDKIFQWTLWPKHVLNDMLRYLELRRRTGWQSTGLYKIWNTRE